MIVPKSWGFSSFSMMVSKLGLRSFGCYLNSLRTLVSELLLEKGIADFGLAGGGAKTIILRLKPSISHSIEPKFNLTKSITFFILVSSYSSLKSKSVFTLVTTDVRNL